MNNDNCVAAASLAPEPIDTAVERWLNERMLEERTDTTTAGPSSRGAASRKPRDLLRIGGRSYRVIFLFHRDAAMPYGLFGAAVVANDGADPVRCSPTLQRAIADQLHRGLAQTRVEITTAG